MVGEEEKEGEGMDGGSEERGSWRGKMRCQVGEQGVSEVIKAK